MPASPPRAIICLLHGGFWRMPYDRHEMTPLAEALVEDGFAVWNIEYRRVGGGGGFPQTFLDVALAIDHLAVLVMPGVDLPLERVVVAGHSAGGHLALWSAARGNFPTMPPKAVTVAGVVGLAPVADLVAAHNLSLGRSAVAEFLAVSPQEDLYRYQVASPAERLPLGVKQLIVHGTKDEALPVTMSRAYASKAEQAGDTVTFVEVSEAGHMDFLDPKSDATMKFRDWLANFSW